ncbi:MAG: hypothetical protein OFPII_41260 [Osedax symbiont Rs1]|nr:MAG: hypothetical protein OFPII_41260 [Osedax symbiont Rs1]
MKSLDLKSQKINQLKYLVISHLSLFFCHQINLKEQIKAVTTTQ